MRSSKFLQMPMAIKPTPAVLIYAWCDEQGVPRPTREHKFCPHRDWAIDFAWVDAKVALEVEGGVWSRGRHTRGAGFLGDVAKYNELALRRWLLLRATPGQVADGTAFGLLWRALK